MPHNFAHHEKISGLSRWADKLQERLDTLKDAIQTADTLERVDGIPEDKREWAVRNAIDEAMEFARHSERWVEHYDRIKVSPDRYREAYRLALEIAIESDTVDNRQVFKVPVWATERVVNRLKLTSIKFKVNNF